MRSSVLVFQRPDELVPIGLMLLVDATQDELKGFGRRDGVGIERKAGRTAKRDRYLRLIRIDSPAQSSIRLANKLQSRQMTCLAVLEHRDADLNSADRGLAPSRGVKPLE